MAHAICLKANNPSCEPIRALWAEFGRFEPVPSMAALNYPPHLTLAIYDSIGEHLLHAAARSVSAIQQQPIQLRFNRVAFFEHPRLVFWAAPDRSEPLYRAHQEVHRHIKPSLCRDHYQPGTWVPHCTLATEVRDADRQNTIAFSRAPFEPFEVIFDTIDCVEFPPVRVTEELLF